jgi:hypothetical protein
MQPCLQHLGWLNQVVAAHMMDHDLTWIDRHHVLMALRFARSFFVGDAVVKKVIVVLLTHPTISTLEWTTLWQLALISLKVVVSAVHAATFTHLIILYHACAMEVVGVRHLLAGSGLTAALVAGAMRKEIIQTSNVRLMMTVAKRVEAPCWMRTIKSIGCVIQPIEPMLCSSVD